MKKFGKFEVGKEEFALAPRPRIVTLVQDKIGVSVYINGYSVLMFKDDDDEIFRYSGAARDLGFRSVGWDQCAFEGE